MSIDIKLSKDKREDLVSRLRNLIQKYDNQYQEFIEPLVIERRLLYESDRNRYKFKYPKLSEISDATDTSVHDVIEWTMPPLMKILFSSNDVIALRGVTEQDDGAAKVMEKLITYQITRNNEGFIKFYDWFKASLIDNFGVMKCWWEYEEVSDTYKVTVSDDELYGQHPQQMMVEAMAQMGIPPVEQLQAALPQMPPEQAQQVMQTVQQLEQRFAGMPEIEGLLEKQNIIIEDIQQVSENVNVARYRLIQEVSKNQPEFLPIPPSQFRFDILSDNIRNSDLLIHRMPVNGDWLHRMEREGMLENVDKAIENYGAADDYWFRQTQFDLLMRNEISMYDAPVAVDSEKSKNEYIYHECWYNTDINDDGILEKLVVGLLGNTIVRLEENTLGEHPFFVIMPIREPYRLIAKTGVAELVGEIQDIKTCLIRQMISGISQANDRQIFVKDDALIDVAELAEGKKAVRVTENPGDVVYIMPWEAIDGSTIPLIEMLGQMKEDRTGITKYSMGMSDPRANTATEASITSSNASTRIEMLVRMCIEGAGGVKDLFRFLIKLNQTNITQQSTIRIAGEDFVIQPEDLSGKINIEVNTGLALGSKTERFQNLNVLMQMYPAAIQAGVANNGHAAFAFQKLIEEMGYKDVSHFCYTPEEAYQQQQQREQAQQEAMRQNELDKKQLELEKANTTANAGIEQEQIRQKGAMERELIKFEQTLAKSNADYEHELNAGSIQDVDRDRRQISVSAPIKDMPAKGQVQALNQIGIKISEKDIEGKQNDELENELKVKRAGQRTTPKANG